ncbi:RHS repeat-associated core domain-containing protein [Pseudoalteromonas sp. CNC9-20]|uniref:RHS repeat-associated core domain-containing protein n=1 Tax=Pseudoalteromonas sp. CNC9-20 TaxID=2917750 RepID=UPI0031BB61A1
MYYYHLDQLDTPQFVTNAHAEVVWQNNTDAFGYSEQIELSPEHITQPLRFQGQYFDAESGLHYNRYRYYSPKQQRFINQDPIGLVGGINHYQYAPNPINWVDPLGLSCKEGQKKHVFAGHGSIDPTRPSTVPAGTTLTVYSMDGATITDDLGSKIEEGLVSSDVFKVVFSEGDTIPGYTLHPNCGSLNISPNSIQVSDEKHISELLSENMGDCHWAACTYIAGHKNSNVIHDEEGIFKEENGQYSQLKDGNWQSLEDEGTNDSTRNPKKISDNLRSTVPASVPKAKKKRKKSLRLKYLGRTPGKKSKTGKEVINRMKAEGKIRSSFKGTEFQASDGEWYPLSEADMAHEPMDAVKYWNTTGRKHGPKSKQVRKWMLDSNNYTLDHYSLNRSAGAKLKERYEAPLG